MDMTDMEKVIKGLGIVSRMLNEMGRRNEMDIVDDAIALLKEQEARIKKFELEKGWDESPDMMGKW